MKTGGEDAKSEESQLEAQGAGALLYWGRGTCPQTHLFLSVTKPLARLLEPLRIATILNIYLSNGM